MLAGQGLILFLFCCRWSVLEWFTLDLTQFYQHFLDHAASGSQHAFPLSLRWVRVGKVPASETESTVESLLENVGYFFRVMAENHVGVSPALENEKPFVTKSPYGKTLSHVFCGHFSHWFLF
jgi:hypothetical protein